MAPKNELPTRPVGRRKLAIGLWLVTHRLALKRLLVFALAATSVGIYTWAIVGVIRLVRGQAAYREMMASLSQSSIDFPTLRPLYSASPLQFSPPQALPAGGEMFDLAVRVTNPNEKFAARSVAFRFLDDRGVVGEVRGFLLPGENKHLFKLGVKQPQGVVRAELIETAWQRVDPVSFSRLRVDRLRLAVENVVHKRGDELGGLAQALSGQTSFSVINRSIWGYWDVGLYVTLNNGEQLVAVNYARVRRLAPQERQPVTVNWSQALPLFTAVTVIPEIDLFDERAFFKESRPPSGVPR